MTSLSELKVKGSYPMAKRVAKRSHSLQSKVVGILGWIVLLAGLVPMWQFFYPIVQSGSFQPGGLSSFFVGFAFLFFGSMLVVASRQSDIKWFCSQCDKELRNKEDKSCSNCLTLLD